MSDPLSVQAAALAAVDRLISLEKAANETPWEARKLFRGGVGTDEVEVVRISSVPDRGFYALGMDRLDGPDARLIAALRNEARAQLEGRRRILQRHAPDAHGYCQRCYRRARFACEDWRDAAAGLPLDQDRGEKACGAQMPERGLIRCTVPANERAHRCILTEHDTKQDHKCLCGTVFSLRRGWQAGLPLEDTD